MNLTKHWAGLLDDYVIDMEWSPDGSRLAAASAAGEISIFHHTAQAITATDGLQVEILPGHDEGTNCIAWAPGGTSPNAVPVLASGGQDGKIKFWDSVGGQHIGSASVGKSGAWVDHIAWRPLKRDARESSSASNALLAVVAGRDLVFLNPDGSVRHQCKPAPKTISAIAWQPAGGALAAAHFGGVQLWDADDFAVQKEFPYNNGIHALLWSPDNHWLVSGNQDPSVHLWIPETGVELHMSGYESKVTTLAFDQASQWLATGGGQFACVWNCKGAGPEGREPDQLPHPAKVCALAFQNAHGMLATASEDGSVMLWSLDRSKPLRATVKMPSAATKLAWSPDDTFLAIGSEKGAVYVLACNN